jgi:hypothetical protein
MNQLIREVKKALRRRFVCWILFTIALMTWCFWPTHGQPFATGKPAPEISGGPWLNSKPLTINDLKGRVVLVEFWTYG